MVWSVLLLSLMLHMSAGEDAVVFDWEGSLVPSRLYGQIKYSIDFGTPSKKVLEIGEASLKSNEHYHTLQSGEKDAKSKSEWLTAVLKKTLLLTKTMKEVMAAIWFSLGIERKGSDFVIRKDYSTKNIRNKRRLRGGRRRGGVFSFLGEILSELISPVPMKEEPFMHPGWSISGKESPYDKEHADDDEDVEHANDDEDVEEDVEHADDDEDVEHADDDVFITVIIEGKHVDGRQAEEPEEPERDWFAELNFTDFKVLRNSAIHERYWLEIKALLERLRPVITGEGMTLQTIGIENFQKAIGELAVEAKRRKMKLVMEDPIDILKNGKWSWQVDVSKGMVDLYLHVPMYKPDFVFDLYRLLSYPIEIQVDEKQTQVEITVEKPFLAQARNSGEFFIALSEGDLSKCQMIHDNLKLCPQLETFRRSTGIYHQDKDEDSCMHSLFNRRFIESARTCAFRRMVGDYVRPVMSTTVLVGTRNKYRAEIDCGNGNLYDVDATEGKGAVHVDSGCFLRGKNFLAQGRHKDINENYVTIHVSDSFKKLIADKLEKNIYPDNSRLIAVIIVCSAILGLLLFLVVVVGVLILFSLRSSKYT